jgi:hypothetical protein
MATLRVRYRDGSEDVWSRHEQMQLNGLGDALHRALCQGGGISFGVESKSGASRLRGGMVALRMDDMIMWELDGFVDEERLASWWQPLGEGED